MSAAAPAYGTRLYRPIVDLTGIRVGERGQLYCRPCKRMVPTLYSDFARGISVRCLACFNARLRQLDGRAEQLAMAAPEAENGADSEMGDLGGVSRVAKGKTAPTTGRSAGHQGGFPEGSE